MARKRKDSKLQEEEGPQLEDSVTAALPPALARPFCQDRRWRNNPRTALKPFNGITKPTWLSLGRGVWGCMPPSGRGTWARP